jgi:hypothetical protein
MYDISIAKLGYIDEYWQVIFSDGSGIQFGSEEEYLQYCCVATELNSASESIKRLAASLVSAGLISMGDVVRYEPTNVNKQYVIGI